MLQTAGSLVAAAVFLGLALVSSLGGDNGQPAYVTLAGRSVDARIIGAVCLAVAAALAANAVIVWRARR